MSLISIIGTPLYQWETGRKLKVIPLRGMRVDSVHISNYGDRTALVVKPREENGVYIADIPNILLQDDRSIAVYSVNVSEDKTETLRECVFSIRKRAKPSDYIYTETEVFTYKALEERLSALEENGVGEDQIEETVNGYLQELKENGEFNGEDGGYYAPSVKQVDDDTIEMSFVASKDGMIPVKPKTITLPRGANGKDYVLTEDDKQEIADMIPSSSFSVKENGAIGDGVADDTEAIQTALDACHANGGGTVIIPTGTYLLSDAVKFYSNQHIKGEPGAVLLQKDGGLNNLIRNYYAGQGGYDATENVIIEGITFDGGTQEEVATTLLTFCHSRNIQITNCTFRSGYSYSGQVGNGHDIEINSSHNVIVSGCTFHNNRRWGYSSEIVQIDGAYAEDSYPWTPDEGERNDDGTVSDGVTVKECIFIGETRESLALGNTFVGSHGLVTNKNIVVDHCIIRNACYGVIFNAVDGLTVRDNIIYDTAAGVMVKNDNANAVALDNIFYGTMQTPYNPKVIGQGNILNGVPVEDVGGIEVSGAVPGQFLMVKEVDENGVPTAWETAEPPKGGEEWELIVDYTVPEGVQIDTLEFTKDLDGNDFNLKKCVFYTVITATEEGSNSGREIYCITSKTAKKNRWDNGVRIGDSLAAGDPASKKKGYMVYLEVVGNTFLTYGYSPQNDGSLWNSVGQYIYRTMGFNASGVMHDGCSNTAEINAFRIHSLNTNIMGVGSKIKIMGVRK